MKLKVNKKPKVVKKEPEKEKEELYGFDLDFLQSMGLGDMIQEMNEPEEPEEVKQNEPEPTKQPEPE